MDFKALISKIDSLDKPAETLTESVVAEKAVSKKQQKFFGMVHAAKKGEKPASKEVAKVAKGISGKEAEKFASTKHKGLPEKKKSKKESVEFDKDAFRNTFESLVAEAKAKPDFLDVDKDGDKKEPMKKAIKDKGGAAKGGKKGMSDKQKKYFGKKGEKTNEAGPSYKDTANYLKSRVAAGVKSNPNQAQTQNRANAAFGQMGSSTNTKVGNTAPKTQRPTLSKDPFGDLDKEMGETSCKSKKGKKKMNESFQFVGMMKMVKESGGQQAIDPIDTVLWAWANRVANSKLQESSKAELFAAMIYERNGGRFEMYDVMEKALTED